VSTSPVPTPRTALQQRVSEAILEAAAKVLAAEGDQASMLDIAAAAGVGRATVYRYFPSRQALLDELAGVAVERAREGLSAAGLDTVPAPEAVSRAVRALVAVGEYFVVLERERVRPDPSKLEEQVGAPLLTMIERGQAAGEIRSDVPASWLTEALLGLVVSILLAPRLLGAEDTIAAITSLFLNGCAGPRSGTPASEGPERAVTNRGQRERGTGG
jgi:TetR/AcrR family transcriptional regulator, mexCD-oprJ operon repressor